MKDIGIQYCAQSDRELLKFQFLRSRTTTPLGRFYKVGWRNEHQDQVRELEANKSLKTILLGDSLVKGLYRYKEVWEQFFGRNTINCGIGGDKVENVLWRSENLRIPPNIKDVVIHCGTNNIDFSTPNEIVNGLMCTAIIIAKSYKYIRIHRFNSPGLQRNVKEEENRASKYFT